MIDLDKALWPVSAASEISRLKAGTGRSWVQKGYLLLGHGSAVDWRAPVPGAMTLLSTRTVLQMALGAALSVLGFHPRDACRIAIGFSAFSDDDRLPGELYGGAFTYLVAYPRTDVGFVMRVDRKTAMQTIFGLKGEAPQNSAAVVFVDLIHKRVTLKAEQVFTEQETLG